MAHKRQHQAAWNHQKQQREETYHAPAEACRKAWMTGSDRFRATVSGHEGRCQGIETVNHGADPTPRAQG